MDLFQNKCYFIKKFSKKGNFLPSKSLFGYRKKKMSVDHMPKFTAAGESHKGCVRLQNEDNFCFAGCPGGYCLAAVADGVGGHSGGEVASYLCCHRLLLDWKDFFKKNDAPTDAELAGFLDRAIKNANADIYSAGQESRQYQFMCTTLAAAVFTPRMVLVAHVGDSRVYCCRDKVCRQLTVDHTVLNEMYEKGIDDSTQLPGAHVISRALGSLRNIKVELHSYFHQPGDRFLICSDGLSCCWRENEIANIIAESAAPRDACGVFIRETLRRGAVDNVTVVTVF